MIDPITTIMGGAIVAIVSGAAGNYFGSNGRIKDPQCVERREACSSLILEKIDHLVITVNELKTSITDLKTG